MTSEDRIEADEDDVEAVQRSHLWLSEKMGKFLEEAESKYSELAFLGRVMSLITQSIEQNYIYAVAEAAIDGTDVNDEEVRRKFFEMANDLYNDFEEE